MTVFAIYGTFGSTQDGHANMHGAELLERVHTAPSYRLYRVDDRWPALIRAADGAAIEVELYECTEAQLARLAALEPPGWNRAPLALEDGREVEAFIGDESLVARGVDVSEHGSWAAHVASRASGQRLH
jgi:allophanate hydrolase